MVPHTLPNTILACLDLIYVYLNAWQGSKIRMHIYHSRCGCVAKNVAFLLLKATPAQMLKCLNDILCSFSL